MFMVLKKSAKRSNVTFSTKGSAEHESSFTIALIALTFLFVFYGSTSGFGSDLSTFSSITGMASGGSSNYVDSYSLDLGIRREIRNDVKILTSSELAGLNPGSVITNLGTVAYSQEIVFGHLEDEESIGNQLLINYGQSEGLSLNYVGDFIYLDHEVSPNELNAFFEYNLKFTNGLKSNYASGTLEDLIGSSIEIVAEEYEIFSAVLDPVTNSITLGLVNFILENSLTVGEEELYLLDSKDYTVEVLNIPSFAPKKVTFNLTGGNIVDEVVTLGEGETHYLSDGVPLVVKTINLNETPISGFVDGNSSITTMGQSYAVAWLDIGYAGFVDTENNAVRVRILGGTEIITVAGNGSSGDADGNGSAARFNSPKGIAGSKDPNTPNTFYVADTENHKIKKVELIYNSTRGKYDSAEVTTIAGTGQNGGLGSGTYGNDTWFNSPEGIHATGGGKVYVADTGNNVIRMLTPNGGTSSNEPDNWDVEVWAGTTLAGCLNGAGSNAKFNAPTDLTFDFTQGYHENMFVVDSGNHMIRRISNNGSKAVSSFASECVNNAGVSGYVDGNSSESKFDMPYGIVIDPITNNIFVTDVNNHVIRQIDNNTGEVSTYAGSGIQGYLNGVPDQAKFNFPRGIGTVNGPDLLIMDTANFMFRMFTGGEVITQFGDLTEGNSVDFYIGGDFLELSDNDYTDGLFDDGGLTLGNVAVPEVFVKFDVDDSNLSGVSIDAMSYRLVPVSESDTNLWLNETFSLSELLDNPEAMIGSFDVVYDGLSSPTRSNIKLVSNSDDNVYNLSFENVLGESYNFPYISNEGSVFKYGSSNSMFVFIEGEINGSSSATAHDQNFTIGIGDYFLISSLKDDASNLNTAQSHIFRYESINSANSVVTFTDLKDDTTLDVTFTDPSINGVLGKGTLTVGGVNYELYVGNLSNNSLEINPLAIDQDSDGIVKPNTIGIGDMDLDWSVLLVSNYGGVYRLGKNNESVGGIWEAVNDFSGNWSVDDNLLTIDGDYSNFKLISAYEEFGYNSSFQTLEGDCSLTSEIICNNVLPVATETKMNVSLTNNLDYLALVSVEVESCSPRITLISNMPQGTTRLFEFENCTGQQLVGRNIEKDVSISYQIGNTGNETNVTHSGNLISRITGDVEVCLVEESFVNIKKLTGMKVGITNAAGDSYGTCGFKLNGLTGLDQSQGMTSYGAFYNLTGEGIGADLDIGYPSEQVKGTVAFVSGSSESGCSPLTQSEACVDVGLNCGSVSDNCGGMIDCGSCSGNETCGGSGTANVCGDGSCTPLTQSEACSDQGLNCGSVSDGCSSTYDCGSCSGNETCGGYGGSANVCEGNTCSSNSDCNSGYVCTSGLCVSGSGGNYSTFYFDLDNDNSEEFDLVELDLVIVSGLDIDYTFELNRVYTDGKIKLKIDESSLGKIYLDEEGDIANVDLDEENGTDLYVESISVDPNDDEATVSFTVGEYVSTGGSGDSGSSGYCGDGSCGNGESTFTCPSDCGTSSTVPTAGSSTGGTSFRSMDTSGGYGGAVVIQQEKDSSLLWVIIGILVVLVAIVVVMTFMKKGGSKKFVKVKPKKVVKFNNNIRPVRKSIGNGNRGW